MICKGGAPEIPRSSPPTRCRSGQAHLRRTVPPPPRRSHRGGRHRPCRNVDGRHVRSQSPRQKLSAQRRAARLGVPGGLGANAARRASVVTFWATPGSGTTSPRSRRQSAGRSMPSRWSTTTAAATNRSAASTAPTGAGGPSRRASCGPQQGGLRPAGGGHGGSASESKPGESQARWASTQGRAAGGDRRGHRYRCAGAVGGFVAS